MRIPLDRIDPFALPRDRSVLDRTPMDELRASILANGLRQPIEVFATETGYGLLSGFRRLTAFGELHDRTGDPTFAEIDAILRTPADRRAAVAAVVEENDIRVGLTPWERASYAIATTRTGLFDTLDAAIAGLYPFAARQKRAKIRAIAEVVESLGDSLTDAVDMSENRLLRLSAVLRLGWEELVHAALIQGARTPQAQWDRLRPLLDEAETLHKQGRSTNPNRPKRLSRPRPGLVIRRETTEHGYSLHLTGPNATAALMREAMEQLEFWLGER